MQRYKRKPHKAGICIKKKTIGNSDVVSTSSKKNNTIDSFSLFRIIKSRSPQSTKCKRSRTIDGIKDGLFNGHQGAPLLLESEFWSNRSQWEKLFSALFLMDLSKHFPVDFIVSSTILQENTRGFPSLTSPLFTLHK